MTLACDLTALGPEERAQRAALAERVLRRATRTAELADGYALQLSPDRESAEEALAWLLLESRCCPFLRLELSLEPERGPLWIRLRGEGVKPFLAAAGLAPDGV
jgi:hypothetical protein